MWWFFVQKFDSHYRNIWWFYVKILRLSYRNSKITGKVFNRFKKISSFLKESVDLYSKIKRFLQENVTIFVEKSDDLYSNI